MLWECIKSDIDYDNSQSYNTYCDNLVFINVIPALIPYMHVIYVIKMILVCYTYFQLHYYTSTNCTTIRCSPKKKNTTLDYQLVFWCIPNLLFGCYRSVCCLCFEENPRMWPLNVLFMFWWESQTVINGFCFFCDEENLKLWLLNVLLWQKPQTVMAEWMLIFLVSNTHLDFFIFFLHSYSLRLLKHQVLMFGYESKSNSSSGPNWSFFI